MSSSALGSSTAVEDYLERILELINSKGTPAWWTSQLR